MVVSPTGISSSWEVAQPATSRVVISAANGLAALFAALFPALFLALRQIEDIRARAVISHPPSLCLVIDGQLTLDMDGHRLARRHVHGIEGLAEALLHPLAHVGDATGQGLAGRIAAGAAGEAADHAAAVHAGGDLAHGDGIGALLGGAEDEAGQQELLGIGLAISGDAWQAPRVGEPTDGGASGAVAGIDVLRGR